MKPNHKKYTFEIEIPIMEAFKQCCEMYEVTQQDMVNNVLLKFINDTEESLKNTIHEIKEEERQPKLFSLLTSSKK